VQRELEFETQREVEKQRAKRVKNVAHRKLLEMQARANRSNDACRVDANTCQSVATGGY
jgi:hypothetical protein